MEKTVQVITIAAIVVVLILTAGCVSDKVIMASKQCSDNQLQYRLAELNALGDKMDNKDVIINQLLNKIGGDSCAQILIAEINGKNKLLNAATLGAVAVAPQYFAYKKDQALYEALSGYGAAPANISINAETGAGGGEGGSSGLIGIHTAVGGSINTGTQQSFDKGFVGNDGVFQDADTVSSDGLF